MTILDDIIAYKRREVAVAKANSPISALESLARNYIPKGFRDALARKASTDFALIAEIKKASPSKGLIRKDFNPADHARAYAAGGAVCLSVLTDEPSFQGSPVFLRQAREAVPLPILRKDFMIDPYQVVEARAWGADCILIVLACVDDVQASELLAAATDYDLDVLVETHTAEEMSRASALNAELIGVNNRNLDTFVTDITVTGELAGLAPPAALLVSESGIHSHADLKTLSAAGAKAFLVGESLMRHENVEAATQALLLGPSSAA